MTHAVLFMVIASVAIAVYLGLATHVVTRSPRRLINWVFGVFCLTIAGYYLSSLFLFSGTAPPAATPLALRLKWAAISFGPTLYLQLTSFYFAPAWQRVRRWILLPTYLLSTGFLLAALSTDLLVAGPLYRPPPHIIGPIPGPLMYLYAVFFALGGIGGSLGLVAGYRAALTPSLRRQILYLLVPSALVILSSAVNWIILLSQDTGQVPHEPGGLLLIIAGFLYTGAVLRYGSFIGRPMARRDLFYSVLGAAAGLFALYLTLTLDQRLMAYTPFPYPVATAILVVVAAVSFPAAIRRVTNQLDGLLFRAERQQQAMVHHLVRALAETPDPAELQAELLGALCAALGVRGGYIALTNTDSSPETLTVRVVRGMLSVRTGDHVRQPSLRGEEPRLVSALSRPQAQSKPGWGDVALFCPLAGNPSGGIVALAEKRNGKPFTRQDLAFCSELPRQIEAVAEIHHLRGRRNHYLEAANLHDQALRRLEEKVMTSAHQALASWEHRTPPPAEVPLGIRVLGPLQVTRNGEPVPEAAWGTEKAKAMLAYLLWKNSNGATREEISTALWPGRPIEETANVFHVTLHRLRRVLEPEQDRGSLYILYQGGRYRFNTGTPHRLDATAFQTLAGEGEPAALREMVALYRGSFLDDVGWALPPEVEWERQVIERLYIDALRRLAAHTEGQESMLYLEKLLAVEPTDEAAQRALMTSYLARGRRDLARRQVAHWREALAELDLEPSPGIRALWEMANNNGHL